MKKSALLLIFLPLFFPVLSAQDNFTSSSEALLQVSTLPEAKLGFTQRFVFPFLQGSSPLTEGNNIALALTGEASPVSLNALFEAVWTPIAFIELSAGARLGVGWPIKLFGEDLYGTGLNLPRADSSSVYDGKPFDALMWKIKLGGKFQFDLAAVFPGDWNHVVFMTYHEINYHANTRAKTGQAWYFENDAGENMNGFNYYGNFVLGYQMPLFLNMIGLLAETDLYLYDTPGRSAWGDDMIRWTLSGLLSFEITKNWSVAVLTQFRTHRNFEQANWKDIHYQSRIVDKSNPLRIEFFRVAAAVTFKF